MAERVRTKWFFVRVTVLLAVLVVVALYAWRDAARRKERTQWNRTLAVALVVVRDGAVSDSAVSALRSSLRDVEAVLGRQLARHRAFPARPFSFVAYGPVALEEPVPPRPEDGAWAAVNHAWALRRFTADIDERASVPARGFDARIYVVVRPPSEQGFVEGTSEHGGRVGIALAELDETNVALALFVVVHELFHTLGATDRYGPDGRTLVPDGLAEPELSPPFPQRYVEIMARNRPVDATREVPPSSLEELWVGEKTAREIGWASVP